MSGICFKRIQSRSGAVGRGISEARLSDRYIGVPSIILLTFACQEISVRKMTFLLFGFFKKIPPAQFKCSTAHVYWGKFTITGHRALQPLWWESWEEGGANGINTRGGASKTREEESSEISPQTRTLKHGQELFGVLNRIHLKVKVPAVKYQET